MLDQSWRLGAIEAALSQTKLTILIASKSVNLALHGDHSAVVDATGHLGDVDIPRALLGHRDECAASFYAQLAGHVAAPHHHLRLLFGHAASLEGESRLFHR
uniref:Uncharacterized protein n=1 Tax=Favella ehrenbergii TaxID=182087 RepID=A0A7S3I7Z7_9SPIT